MSDLFLGAAAEYAARVFNAELEENTVEFVAGLSVLQMVKEDPERIFLAVTNLSVNDVYIYTKTSVSQSIGIRLSSNGGSMILNAKDDFILPTSPRFVLSDGANSTLTVTTMRRFGVSQ